MRKTKSLFVLTVLVLLSPVGCDVSYFMHLATGELASLASTVPIEQALHDTRLSEEERAKIALTLSVRQFGVERIGLIGGNAYTVFEMNGAEPAAYILSASVKEGLTPYQWTFPFIGQVEVKPYFNESWARQEANRLLGEDYDVFLGLADGFSTLGILPDPVRQSNLKMDEIDLAELILHELTHATVVKLSDMDFMESVATFVGRAAAQAWFDEVFGPDSAEALAARLRFADKVVIDDYVNAVFAHMRHYYEDAAAQGKPRDEIVAGREARFQTTRAWFETEFLPRITDQERWGPVGWTDLNNATLLGAMRYEASLSDFQAVLDKVGGNLPEAIEVYKEAAASPDSREFLRNWTERN